VTKAKHCDECKHSYNRDWDLRLHCNKGHKPKFYKPKNLHCTVFTDSWGWKRRCEDFEIHPLQALADQAQELGIK